MLLSRATGWQLVTIVVLSTKERATSLPLIPASYSPYSKQILLQTYWEVLLSEATEWQLIIFVVLGPTKIFMPHPLSLLPIPLTPYVSYCRLTGKCS